MYNRNMKQARGFTIIETSLFLSLSALLIVGLFVGTSAAIARQRYHDSVQDFSEFMRRVYSQVINVENPRLGAAPGGQSACTVNGMVTDNGNFGNVDNWSFENYDPNAKIGFPGRTNCAIYGKLITFGEEDNSIIHVYDIIGKTFDINANLIYTPLQALGAAGADIVTVAVAKEHGIQTCSYKPVGQHYQYEPQWRAIIETKEKGKKFKGSIMIARSPISGAVHTYVLEKKNSEEGVAIGATKLLSDPSSLNVDCNSLNNLSVAQRKGLILSSFLPRINKDDGSIQAPANTEAEFKSKDADLCIGSDDVFALSGHRRHLRLAADGRNSTAVELTALDLGASKCQ